MSEPRTRPTVDAILARIIARVQNLERRVKQLDRDPDTESSSQLLVTGAVTSVQATLDFDGRFLLQPSLNFMPELVAGDSTPTVKPTWDVVIKSWVQTGPYWTGAVVLITTSRALTINWAARGIT